MVGESVRSYLDMLPRLVEMEKAALASQISSFSLQESGRQDDALAILVQEKKMIKLKAELQR